MELRKYQQEALAAVRQAMNDGMKNPLVCISTGGGKSPIICTLAHQLAAKGHQVTITVHTQELITQLKETYERITNTTPAVYAASLGKKDVGQVTVAQIQSACRNPGLFSGSRVIICDECSYIPLDGDGQYRSFLMALRSYGGDIRTVGFTATPYRLSGGLVYGPGLPFDDMVYDAGITPLMEQGYLCPLRSKHGATPNLDGVSIRAGEFVSAELEVAVSDIKTVEAGVLEIVKWGKDRRAWLVFAAGVKHANLIAKELQRYEINAPVVTGDMRVADRNTIVANYKNRNIRCVVNVNVLSVGFDAPHVDMIAMMRPTNSPGLYYQQCGRGLRISPDKADCLVLDLAGNIERHGPIDTLNSRIERKTRMPGLGVPPMKYCPECSDYMPAGKRECDGCGYEFPATIAKNTAHASRLQVLSSIETQKVSRVAYGVHTPKEINKPSTLKVSYYADSIAEPYATEFVSLAANANPFARRKGLEWLSQIPKTEAKGKRLEIRGNEIYGNDKSLTTVLEFVPYTPCLQSPITISTLPNKDKPKYRQVIARSFT